MLGVLIAVGIDQIAAGSMKLRYGRASQSISLIENGTYLATGSETAAILAPGVLSFGVGSLGSIGRAGARAGGELVFSATAVNTTFRMSPEAAAASIMLLAQRGVRSPLTRLEMESLSTYGRLPLGAKQIEAFAKFMMREHGIPILPDGRLSASLLGGYRLGAGDVAAFVYTASGRAAIVYRNGVNGYVMLHEYMHAIHYIREGRSALRFSGFGHRVTEQFVYDNLKMRYMHLLTPLEQRNMIEQIFRRNGFAW